MKSMFFCMAALAVTTLFANEFPPEAAVEEAPFQIVIEDVPETADPTPPSSPAAVPAPAPKPVVPVATPVADPVAPQTADAEDVVETIDAIPEVDVEEEPNCAHALRPPKAYDREVLMLQIFLDRHNFSGGVIDGVWGASSLEAMRAWQHSNGYRQTSWVDVPLYAEIATMPAALTRYAITAEDLALVTGPLPATWAERAQMKLLGYESIGACMA
jgi:hypothetical protein